MPPQTGQSLVCPKCGEAIKLTESLAAPLVAATRAEYERQVASQAKTFEAERLTLNAQKEANDRRARIRNFVSELRRSRDGLSATSS